MSDSVLDVSWDGRLIGHLSRDSAGRMTFEYTRDWLDDQKAIPISQSLPLKARPFEEDECLPFFSGLLPDGRQARNRLSELFHVSGDNDFGLLENIGRECAGAIAITKPGTTKEERAPWIEKLTEAQLAQMIRDLPHRPLFADPDEIMLSLAGVNDKAALLRGDDGALYLPHRGYPSSHILKTDIHGLPDSIRTENFALHVAKKLMIDVPPSHIYMAEDQVYMLVARYDRNVRVHSDASREPVRVHQEDFCQAMGVMPSMKYEREGGPTLPDMFNVLRRAATVPAKEVGKLVDYVLFNFLIGNPDSHAKNYSIVYRHNKVELSPLYDVNNAAAFRKYYKSQRPRFAQSIGGERNPDALTEEHFKAFAEECDLRYAGVGRRLQQLCRGMPLALDKVREKMRDTVEDTPALDLIVEDVKKRCERVSAWYEPAAPRVTAANRP